MEITSKTYLSVYNENNQYTIALYNAPATAIPPEYRTKGVKTVQFSACGTALPQEKKYDIRLQGDFRFNEKYGLTLQVQYSELLEPTDLEGIQQYLIDFIDGCGEKTAKRITTYFGSETIDVLKNHTDRLYEVPRLRKFTVEKIIESYKSKKDLQEIVVLLSPFGISHNNIINIQNYYDSKKGNSKNNKAVEEIKNNPFVLSRFSGISFETLNSMAIRFGCDLTAPERIAEGVKEALRLNQMSGHLCMPQGELRERALYILNNNVDGQLITRDMVTQVICDMAKNLKLLGDHKCAYLPEVYYWENATAGMVNTLLKAKCKRYSADDYLPNIEKQLGIELSKRQRKAVDMAVNNTFTIITGGAGTGKTTVLNSILQIFMQVGYCENDILLMAPTGIAAHRMYESTGHSASTIHSALGLKAEMEDSTSPEEAEKLPYKIVVVDEFSMADMYITYKLFSAIDLHSTRLILLGDTGQLPSVGAGNVLHELLTSEKIPNVELNVIFRQAQENFIVRNSSNVRNGICKIDCNDDFLYFQQLNAEIAAQITTDHFVNAVLKKGISNVQVFSPVKTKGPCSVFELNKRIQETINPSSPDKKEVKVGIYTYRVGDKIMFTKNANVKNSQDDLIYLNNGDIGMVKEIRKSNGKGYLFKIDFGDNRVVNFEKADMLYTVLAYCITIHKSQGSECKHGIIPLLPYFPDALLFRNLLYTGITRCKEKCEIIGDLNCVYRCIRNNQIVKRNTFLAERIIKYFNAA